LIARACEVLIAIGGEFGTLSEVAFALKLGRPVVGVLTWSLTRPDGTPEAGVVVANPEDAVARAIQLAGSPKT
jgi:predicted Rossmann-fold nucleotide-binding protein